MKQAAWILIFLFGSGAMMAMADGDDEERGVAEEEASGFAGDRADTARDTAEDEVDSRRQEAEDRRQEAEDEVDDGIEDAVRGLFD